MNHFRLHRADSRDLGFLSPESVELVVTSPPYPMISMWDPQFSRTDPRIGELLADGRGTEAWEAMHRLLDPVWRECLRVLVPGGFLCVNIGDAVRTLDGDFRLYGNHGRILSFCLSLGFVPLPVILWRKPANSPTKFLGSGMIPPGAYVTLEHEYILILRKGGRRTFSSPGEKLRRRESAYFWEERNSWFSDVWTFTGTGQRLGPGAGRERSAAYPPELARRLICMYSLKGDRVLDPFAGTGTTLYSALALGREGIGAELEPELVRTLREAPVPAPEDLNRVNRERLEAHRLWAAGREAEGKSLKYTSRHYGFPVTTRQEEDILLSEVSRVERTDTGFLAV